MRNRVKAYALVTTALSCMILTGGAFAQDSATSEPTATSDNETVIVTGTRIRSPNAKSAAPITTIDKKELQFQGVLNLEEAINRLTSVRADSTQFTNGSDSDGRAKINLRNLGWQRSLVLLDGRRLLPVQAIDLNIIPSALVKRVDVMSGGASSTYGSDAIAGVVNFVLDKKFEGLQINASYGVYQHTNDASDVRSAISQYPNIKLPAENVIDGGRTDINFAAGKNFADGRGNISIFADFRIQDPVIWGDRDYSACRVNVTASGYSCAVNTLYSEYGTFMPSTIVQDSCSQVHIFQRFQSYFWFHYCLN